MIARIVAVAVVLALGAMVAPAVADLDGLTENASAGRLCVQHQCSSNPVPVDCFVKVASARCGFA